VRLAELVRATRAELVTANRDHSPYARRREAAVRRAIERESARWLDFKDQLLVEPDECCKDDGTPYTVFTPFARRWRLLEKERPQRLPRLHALPTELRARLVSQPVPPLEALGFRLEAEIEPGGERQAKKRLATFVEDRLLSYASDRDAPALDGTSHLSAHLKLGTISVRRVYWDVRESVGDDLANLDPARPPASLRTTERDRLHEGGTFLNEICWRVLPVDPASLPARRERPVPTRIREAALARG
jgi:deoxyribodipyrimidine photo-lyase